MSGILRLCLLRQGGRGNESVLIHFGGPRAYFVQSFRIGLIISSLPFRIVSLFCVTHLHALSGKKKEPGEPYRFGKALRALFTPVIISRSIVSANYLRDVHNSRRQDIYDGFHQQGLLIIQNCYPLSAALVKCYFLHHFPLSGKMILLTKKKMTIDTPPFKTVVPML